MLIRNKQNSIMINFKVWLLTELRVKVVGRKYRKKLVSLYIIKFVDLFYLIGSKKAQKYKKRCKTELQNPHNSQIFYVYVMHRFLYHFPVEECELCSPININYFRLLKLQMRYLYDIFDTLENRNTKKRILNFLAKYKSAIVFDEIIFIFIYFSE